MNNRNLLLGFGETLTYTIPHRQGFSEKSHPYSFEESRLHLLRDTQELIHKINTIPKEAMPNSKVVANFILHPAYIAKSYYPVKFFNEFGFQDIGSKSVSISPRKTQLKNAPESQVATNIFMSGNSDSFKSLINTLEFNRMEFSLEQEIMKNEKLFLFEAEDKVKGTFLQDREKEFEVVVHTPKYEKNVLEAFYHFAKIIGVKINYDKRIETPGLTFLSMIATGEQAQSIASFTYLRVLREMPKLRMFKPLIQRTIHKMPTMSLPEENAKDTRINVAVFDGGIGNTNLSKWCNETIYESGAVTDQEFLNHGSEVTSTILFGNVKEGQTTLPIPYSNIDHYRVLDTSASSEPDLFTVLDRILHALHSKKYQFANLSLGPQIPIEDDDVHVWTSSLDNYLATNNTLLTIAVGNDGNLVDQNRIQPPSDTVNALAVGAANTEDATWRKTDYSCIGPGRSPGLIKPDGIAFGGDRENPFLVYSPISGQIHATAGTSFSSPLVLRTGIGLASTLDTEVNPLALKALLIHNIENKDLPQNEIGRGRFPTEVSQIIFSDDDEVSVIYQGKLNVSEYLRVPIPFPDEEIEGKISIKATFCFTAETNPAHPDSYTNNGLTIVFKPKEGRTRTFFSPKKLYQTESDARKDAHKWETTLHKEEILLASSLKKPCFEVVYQARDAGKVVKKENTEELPYVLVLTLKSKKGYPLYNSIRQQYQILQPIRVKQEVKIRI
ncbi:S8 family peptidase [Sulfurovum sp.]|uniref:S8 family peptidase n=1 Tax=Sulfurovum sp. TaxID=1969726 RepID=UPI0028680212|nr:S8 family peptidase [Sulfurovum sp.]